MYKNIIHLVNFFIIGLSLRFSHCFCMNFKNGVLMSFPEIELP